MPYLGKHGRDAIDLAYLRYLNSISTEEGLFDLVPHDLSEPFEKKIKEVKRSTEISIVGSRIKHLTCKPDTKSDL